MARRRGRALSSMPRRAVMIGASVAGLGSIAWWAAGGTGGSGLPAVNVWKAASCGCCGGWITHMRRAGFAVSVHELDDVQPVKERQGVPEELQSCHTAVVAGYVIEGHVPAGDIRRLLEERPGAKGLAVPGMPSSAPGMDGPREPYEVTLFGGPSGNRRYAVHT
jgi:hypothetical protein